jgi:hypothetical protein
MKLDSPLNDACDLLNASPEIRDMAGISLREAVRAAGKSNIVKLPAHSPEIREAKATPTGAEIADAKRKDTLLGLRTRIDKDTAAPRFDVVGGLFPRSYITFIAAQPGACKSWLAERLAVDMSAGGMILDGIVHNEPPRRVLFFCGESRWGQFKRRADQMRWDITRENLRIYDNWELSKRGFPLDLSTEEGRKNFRAIVSGELPDAILLDSFFDFNSANESESEVMKSVMSYLNGIAEEYHAAIILMHHLRKRKTSEQRFDLTMDEMIGSSMFARSAAAIFLLQRRPVTDSYGAVAEEAVFARCEKSWAKKPLPFALKIEDEPDGFHTTMRVILNPDTGSGQREKVAEAIASNFEVGTCFKRADIQTLCPGAGHATIERVIDALLADGTLSENGKKGRAREYMRTK